MNKRAFLKNTGIAATGLILGESLLSSCKVKSKSFATKVTNTNVLPTKWTWLRPNLKRPIEFYNAAFGELAAAGIEGVLPQIYASHKALFDHPSIPVDEPWLEKIIPIAHKHGLQIHAWMWSMPLNNPELIEKHPDWFSVNRLGEPAHTHPAYVKYYKFLDPCHPEVKEYVQNNVKALAAIEELDGIHLDYIRQPDVILAEALQPKYDIVQDKEYPQYDYPYSTYCREGFKAQTGIDPMDLGEDAPSNKEWRQFRYDAISSLVNDYLVPAAKEKNKLITAAVFPNWESVRQQWHKWDLDGFLPMLYQGFYNKEIPWIGEEVKKAKERLNNNKPVYAGLFLEHLQNPGELEKAVHSAYENGAAGYSLFAHSNMKKNDFETLKKLNL